VRSAERGSPGTRGSAPSPPVSVEGRRRAWGGSSPRPVRPPQPAYRLVGVGDRVPTISATVDQVEQATLKPINCSKD
jgi:hypothetical protein